uniref:Uncharacterized protein n=1 Tax=Timema bartmani TaxID=61472 RepID=A0A7R9I226_9NEOP|nr:unnamed protein product [Timema bartmani]
MTHTRRQFGGSTRQVDFICVTPSFRVMSQHSPYMWQWYFPDDSWNHCRVSPAHQMYADIPVISPQPQPLVPHAPYKDFFRSWIRLMLHR